MLSIFFIWAEFLKVLLNTNDSSKQSMFNLINNIVIRLLTLNHSCFNVEKTLTIFQFTMWLQNIVSIMFGMSCPMMHVHWLIWITHMWCHGQGDQWVSSTVTSWTRWLMSGQYCSNSEDPRFCEVRVFRLSFLRTQPQTNNPWKKERK